MRPPLLSLETRAAIEDLLREYIGAVDDDRLDDWVDCFTEDCVYKIVPRENLEAGLPAGLLFLDGKAMLRDRVTYLRKAAVYTPHWDRHIITNISNQPEGEGLYRSTTNFAVYHTYRDGSSRLYCVGYYKDLIVLDGDLLKFKERTVVLETISVPTLLATPL